MKINWEDAPEWAKYLAMDRDGTWWWHELNPEIDWKFWESEGQIQKLDSEFWKESLQERPINSKLINPSPNPRYDEIYYEGTDSLI